MNSNKTSIFTENQIAGCYCIKCEQILNFSGVLEEDHDIIWEKYTCAECLGIKRQYEILLYTINTYGLDELSPRILDWLKEAKKWLILKSLDSWDT